MSEGPFTDDMAKHWISTLKTQDAIIKYAEAMAQVLAEAGRASAKATGDSPQTAIRRWSQVIQDRALQLVRSPTMKQFSTAKKMIDNEHN